MKKGSADSPEGDVNKCYRIVWYVALIVTRKHTMVLLLSCAVDVDKLAALRLFPPLEDDGA